MDLIMYQPEECEDVEAILAEFRENGRDTEHIMDGDLFHPRLLVQTGLEGRRKKNKKKLRELCVFNTHGFAFGGHLSLSTGYTVHDFSAFRLFEPSFRVFGLANQSVSLS